MYRKIPCLKGVFQIVLITASLITSMARADEWAHPAVRSGVHLPSGRDIAGQFDLGGIYNDGSALEREQAGMVGGEFIWNFRLFMGLGVFGRHMVNAVILGEVTTLMLGHEVGLGFLFLKYFALECAYLGHRFEYDMSHSMMISGQWEGCTTTVWNGLCGRKTSTSLS